MLASYYYNLMPVLTLILLVQFVILEVLLLALGRRLKAFVCLGRIDLATLGDVVRWVHGAGGLLGVFLELLLVELGEIRHAHGYEVVFASLI